MEYKGKLYGKFGKKYFDTGKTANDWDNMEAILATGTAWPLHDVLKKLIEASEILLHKKDYDGHNYEEIEICVKTAKEILIKMNYEKETQKN